MLHICQRCKESWTGRYINAHRAQFDIDPIARTVEACPNCPDAGADEDDDRTTRKHTNGLTRTFYHCDRCSASCILSIAAPGGELWPRYCPYDTEKKNWTPLDHRA